MSEESPIKLVPETTSDHNQKSSNQTPAVPEEKELSTEEKEIKEIIDRYEKYPKLSKWIQLFLSKDNKETFGNRTESAMRSYNCKDRVSAAEIGAQNFRKLKGLASAYAEIKGFGVGKMIDIGLAKTLQSEDPRWYEIMGSMLDFYYPKAQVQIQNNTQNNIQVNEADTIDFQSAFKKFLENE
jgi:hypothetical protein